MARYDIISVTEGLGTRLWQGCYELSLSMNMRAGKANPFRQHKYTYNSKPSCKSVQALVFNELGHWACAKKFGLGMRQTFQR